MSSSSSSSSSSSDSDDDESVKQRKKDKRQDKITRRERRSILEEQKEQKERERRSREVKQRREYLEMKRDEYQRFLLEKQRNPNKEPMTMMIATDKNNRIKRFASRTARKKPWYELSPPRSYIEHGKRQAVTPSIKDWREMMSKKGGKRRNRTMKNRRVHS